VQRTCYEEVMKGEVKGRKKGMGADGGKGGVGMGGTWEGIKGREERDRKGIVTDRGVRE
jgi:hypothetical protein